MAERYQTICKQGAMYQDDCPLVMLASALLRDTATGKMIVQLKMQNVGQKRISAVFVDIECRNVANEDIGHKAFQYLDLQVKPQEIFGTQIPIELPDDTTRYYSAAVSRIVLDNGEIWENTGHCAANPLVIDTIINKQYPKELTEQFIRDSGMHTAEINYPQQISNLKMCACGTVYGSELDNCPQCGYTFEQLQHMLDKAVLQKNYEAYTEDVRTKAEQQRIAEEVRRKKTKKTLAITLPVAAVVIAFAILLPRVILPARDYKKGEALLEAGKFDGAITAFKEAGDYRDASERIPAVYYAQAEDFLAKGMNDLANAAFRAAGAYKDASDRIGEGYYRLAEERLVDKDIEGALSAFASAGTYRDASKRISEIHYAQGEEMLTAGDIAGAIKAFTTAGDVRKARTIIPFDNMISTSSRHTVGLRADGTVVTVGEIKLYEYGMEDWRDIVAVSASYEHTVGLRADGTVVAAGAVFSNGQGNVGSFFDIVSVSADYYHTFGLRKDGTVISTRFTGLEIMNAGQGDVQGWRNIVAVSSDTVFTVGVRKDGTVVAVGSNGAGQCNVQNWRNIVSVATGSYHTAGLRADGSVVAVGDNDDGQCDVQEWRDIVAVAAGESHTVGLRSDGTAVAVGGNEHGQCNVQSWSNIVAVAADEFHTIGLRSDGTVVAVGYNDDGQCNVQDWDLW